MALPRKGRRTITIDGIRYHWIAYMKDNGYWSLSLVIMQADVEGQQLICKPAERTVFDITPGIVRKAIGYALRAGWKPGRPGAQFKVEAFEKHIAEGKPGTE